jgi:hypothetical protein
MSRVRSVVLSAAILGALVILGGASATPPEITRFVFEDHYVDTQTCPGIPIDTRLEGRVSFTEYSPTRVKIRQHLVFQGTGNGRSFTDNESYTEFANPETGVTRFSGTTINIQIPGHGNVLVDAGTLTADFTTNPWTVIHEGGHHPLFHDGYGALCEYLAG